jgi:hypothetical protein
VCDREGIELTDTCANRDAEICIKAVRGLFFNWYNHKVELFCFSGDKVGSEGIVKDVRYRRLDPMSNICTRPLDASPNTINQQHYVNVRRGSVPADINSELRFSNGLARNGNSSKSRIRKKVLCRRSSGGPEMFTDSGPEPFGEEVTWQQWHHELLSRRTVEPALARRRGSLPIEVLATTHSGEPVYPVNIYGAMITELQKVSFLFHLCFCMDFVHLHLCSLCLPSMPASSPFSISPLSSASYIDVLCIFGFQFTCREDFFYVPGHGSCHRSVLM